MPHYNILHDFTRVSYAVCGFYYVCFVSHIFVKDRPSVIFVDNNPQTLSP